MSADAGPGTGADAGTQRTGRQDARALARARRRTALRRAVRDLLRKPGGVAGLVILGFFVVLALLAPLLFPAETLEVTRTTQPKLASPYAGYPFGTDRYGISVLALVAWGARISLLVGISATVISMVLGTLVGIASGHFRNLLGAVLERLTDWFLVIPFLPLVIVLATVLGSSILNVVVVIGITSWPATARLVRAQTLSIEARPYVERSRALGAGEWHLMTRHVLPNVMPLVLANTTLTVAVAIASETTLSFLGLGDPFAVSWGKILDDAFGAGAITAGAWWYLVPPGVCVVLVVLAFTLLGRALEEVLDPRRRSA
ncbi:ABC transporter permease [Kineosporia sp. A_224]|uniref:ABC transporter permease n=1 Tax=Kineosporia sp. A_224 TaxID=1962180 RepID=UPI000B4AE05B|nr:ABC transporter permease [Kineosporia sp. A_224]